LRREEHRLRDGPSRRRVLAKFFERRLSPADSPLAILAATSAAFVAAMLVTSFLFLSYGASPFQVYFALFHEPFGTLRGFGYSLVRTSPLALIALGTIVSWRSGFSYLGFEGCFVIGASTTAWLALLTAPDARIGPVPFSLSLPLALLLGFVAGGVWAGLVGLVRARLGGNEVLISLMSNYVAIFILQYLVSGPMRAPGSLPETRPLPRATWLPFILPGTRAHAGILIAIAAAILVWMLLQKMPLGYELIVTGFNSAAARYAGIDVGRRILLAAFFAGGLGGLAGMVEVLGSQHRLMDGISGGVGFVGIVVALLARLNPVAVIPTALLYGGMSVGADAMQRRADIPSSITFILQSLTVLLVLAFDALRYYKINLPVFSRRLPPPAAEEAPK
jgi:simple sugar transport system permease protein